MNINGINCEILDKHFEFIKSYRTIIEGGYDSQFENYSKINQEENKKNTNDKLSNFTIHQKIQKLNLNNVMMDFDATSLYPSAMYDEKSVFPKKESGFVSKPHERCVCRSIQYSNVKPRR